MSDRQLLDQQIAYYRARAHEYDQWFLRQGRYDRGPAHRDRWMREIAQIEGVLSPIVRGAEVLELACGTGLWTQRLVTSGSQKIVAVDSSPEVIALNRQRLGAINVEYHVEDVFTWRPSAKFDLVFFSFWLSHVPGAEFDAFWNSVRASLKPGGQVFFIDSLLEPTSTAQDHEPLDRSGMSHRRLNDGREFDIVKIFYEPRDLEHRLVDQGWRGWVRATDTFFLYGSMLDAG